MFMFSFIYDYYTMSMNMVSDKMHRFMVISVVIDQCTPGTKTIGRQPRSRATIDALGAGYRAAVRPLRPPKGQLGYFLVAFLRSGGWFWWTHLVVSGGFDKNCTNCAQKTGALHKTSLVSSIPCVQYHITPQDCKLRIGVARQDCRAWFQL